MGESAAVAGGTVVVAAVTVVGASATAKTAPILAFAGAILVALVTAYTANRRQVQALNAESQRLARQLEHDRELADLADTRKVCDDAVVALHDASVALSGLERAFVNYGSGFREKMPNAVPDAESATETLRSIRGRLGVRLPQDNAAVAAFEAAHDATREATNAAATQDPSPAADLRAAINTVQDAHRGLIDATDAFRRAATETVGARLP